MQLVNEFAVRAGAEAAFATLSDLERVVTCIPGARFDGRDGEDFHGRVGLRIGPVGLNLASTATIVELDETARRLVVRGVARDRTGQGGANALVTMTVADEVAGQSRVRVVTDLDLSGRVAQFGGAAIKQVNRRIVAQFIRELDVLLTAVSEEGAETPARPGGEVAGMVPYAAESPWRPTVLARRGGPVAAAGVAGLLLGAVIVQALRRGLSPQPG